MHKEFKSDLKFSPKFDLILSENWDPQLTLSFFGNIDPQYDIRDGR